MKRLASNFLPVIASLLAIVECDAGEGELSDEIRPQTNAATIPKLFGPNGKVTSEGLHFTTKAYEKEALRFVIKEANEAAKDLQLPDNLPIAETNLTRVFIIPYGKSRLRPEPIGNVLTRDYGYFVSVGHKLSYVEGAHQDSDCLRWMDEYHWPKSRMDTAGAYQLATQWLAAARMDVQALNRDCRMHIELDSFANPSKRTTKFVPLYFVYWQSQKNITEGHSSVASVKLFAPTKTLVSLCVEDSKYILRAPIVFTNLDVLLSQTNTARGSSQ